ncbi:MAG: hypothetical protein V2A53_05275 [bacterium]
MTDFETVLRESEEIIFFAQNELTEAKKEQNELLARQVAEKGYLALIKGFNALFIKKGKGTDELPKGERGRRFFIHAIEGKGLENFYGALRDRLHIDGFHEGIYIFDSLEEDLDEIEKFISQVKDGGWNR